MEVFDLKLEEVASFDGGVFRFWPINGPIRLARFGDSTRGTASKMGRYWMYASELAEVLAVRHAAKAVIKEASQRWAIADDWGDMELIWFMNVPRGDAVQAAGGHAKFQPKISADGQDRKGLRKTRRSYEGGSMQLIIPVQDTDGRPNSYLLSLITGPVPTAKAATAPERFV